MPDKNKIQLNAPAGNFSSLTAAVDAGADSVYFGFRSPTNLRNLPGLNFSVPEAAEAVEYAHRYNAKVCVTVNSFPMDHQLEYCLRAVDDADDIGADAVIATDLAVLDYIRNKHPNMEIHLSCVTGAADSEAIRFYQEEFGVSCVILPRVLSIEQIAALRRRTDVILEVMVFGVLCVNYDGRCYLSSFITGTSANSIGACAPAEFVHFEENKDGTTTLALNGIVINDSVTPGQQTYPTPCKGRYYNSALGCSMYAFQDPCCLNALSLLPKLKAAGVDVLKIEGRQRSQAYVRQVVTVWRKAIDILTEQKEQDSSECGEETLGLLSEGMVGSLGALNGG